jgi:hypothetical protein
MRIPFQSAIMNRSGRAHAITVKGIAERHAQAIELLSASGDLAIVSRGVVRALVMRCPDGCGETITVNLDERAGPAWKFYDRNETITLYPSVWRATGCRAHFVLWRNKLLWTDEPSIPTPHDEELYQRVRAALPSEHESPLHFEQLAAKLAAIPWEVLWTCQRLVRQGIAFAVNKGTRFSRTKKLPDSES